MFLLLPECDGLNKALARLSGVQDCDSCAVDTCVLLLNPRGTAQCAFLRLQDTFTGVFLQPGQMHLLLLQLRTLVVNVWMG